MFRTGTCSSNSTLTYRTNSAGYSAEPCVLQDRLCGPVQFLDITVTILLIFVLERGNHCHLSFAIVKEGVENGGYVVHCQTNLRGREGGREGGRREGGREEEGREEGGREEEGREEEGRGGGREGGREGRENEKRASGLFTQMKL